MWSLFTHVYQELNSKVDALSKEAMEMEVGAFISKEFFEGHMVEEMLFLLYISSYLFPC
jgi:phage I-like protein